MGEHVHDVWTLTTSPPTAPPAASHVRLAAHAAPSARAAAPVFTDPTSSSETCILDNTRLISVPEPEEQFPGLQLPLPTSATAPGIWPSEPAPAQSAAITKPHPYKQPEIPRRVLHVPCPPPPVAATACHQSCYWPFSHPLSVSRVLVGLAAQATYPILGDCADITSFQRRVLTNDSIQTATRRTGVATATDALVAVAVTTSEWGQYHRVGRRKTGSLIAVAEEGKSHTIGAEEKGKHQERV